MIYNRKPSSISKGFICNSNTNWSLSSLILIFNDNTKIKLNAILIIALTKLSIIKIFGLFSALYPSIGMHDNESKNIIIDGLIKKDVEFDSQGNIWSDIWDYLGHQKYMNSSMVINAELRLPWYFCYQENDSEKIYHYAREKVKNDIEMFDKYFEDEYNIDGMYN